MTADADNATAEKAVQVTLPDDDRVTEVELNPQEVKVSDSNAKIEQVKSNVDERERALEDLKKQYEHQKRVAEAERDARRKAEQFAQQQTQNVQYASTQVQDSNLKIIETAIQTTESTAGQAERAYADAMAAGDYATAARAQRALAQAETHLLQLENGRQRLQEQLQEMSEGAVQAPRIPSFEPQIPQDPVEMFAAKLTPRSADWLRSHPDAVTKIARLTRAHEDAIEDGITPESNEYFNYIEGRLGYAQNNRAPAPKRSLASAPVSSNTSYSSPRSNDSGNVMTLAPSEVEVALLMEPELPRDKAIEAYARNKAVLIKQGKLSA